MARQVRGAATILALLGALALWVHSRYQVSFAAPPSSAQGVALRNGQSAWGASAVAPLDAEESAVTMHAEGDDDKKKKRPTKLTDEWAEECKEYCKLKYNIGNNRRRCIYECDFRDFYKPIPSRR
eukprot:TRINITY_DN2435_c0_g1_i1.p1 TRINITY_DN2435_c0_g1~~TRINITY_DN2435_c0_g1_i1.p1  ORF type:complete len:146 (+),score=38.46 TRINITY_DN2435_c0_g1_i1:66-440(+)